MEKSKDYYRLTALRFLANGISLLEDIEDLKETKLYTKKLKYYGNKFVSELEKSVVPMENALHDSKDIEVVNQLQKVVQKFNQDIVKGFIKD
tara:strand:+ start:1644 stop:1919 length:276 start_codon:yes stop_codon:yes gene_type:complete